MAGSQLESCPGERPGPGTPGAPRSGRETIGGMELTVKTTAGLVRGVEASDGVYAFRGVPYAEAPVGPLRFKPPARREPWDGTRDATRFGDVVPQAHSPG